MAEYKLLMPKMGESVIEATILSWHKNVGDKVSENEVILEVATDKVDSEVPSPVSGVIKKILHDVNEAVGVGEPLAIIEVEGDAPEQYVPKKKEEVQEEQPEEKKQTEPEKKKEEIVRETDQQVPFEHKEPEDKEQEKLMQQVESRVDEAKKTTAPPERKQITQPSSANRYYSPLVLNIAQVESIPMQELENIEGSGAENRVTKEDILAYIEQRKKQPEQKAPSPQKEEQKQEKQEPKKETEEKPVEKTQEKKTEPVSAINKDSNIEVIEMDRMRKLISQHMVNSRKTSAHVSSIIECDVTNIVRWRDQHKDAFKKREGFSLSFMPVFIEAVTRAIKEYPMVNVSVDGDKILRKKYINVGIATALATGNLIVPVVKNCDQKSLLGIAKSMNELVVKARSNSLQPDDISDGTYTITNIGSFGNIIGTPIINQPQVAILAVGAITKKPVVIEFEGQDVIAIRHMMYLSHTFDHRVVDGMLGGLFIQKVAEFLEKFDVSQEI